jgi:hypothetical protein
MNTHVKIEDFKMEIVPCIIQVNPILSKVLKPRSQWLTPVIPAIWDAEFKRITVRGQMGKKVNEPSSSTNNWVQWHTPVIPSYKRG